MSEKRLYGQVSVPWSGFINRKLTQLFGRAYVSQFQSRGRDLLIGKRLSDWNYRG